MHDTAHQSNDQHGHVEDLISAGAQALHHSAMMFGTPSPTDDDNATPATETELNIDDVLSESAQALHKSAQMFGDPLGENSKNGDAKEDDNQAQNCGGDDDDAVDVLVGAGAQALHASAMMFGDPLGEKAINQADGSGQSEDDVINDDGDDGVICGDEADITHHDDFFNIDVRIRLVEENDESAIRSLIYDGIYVAALNRYIVKASERPFVITAVGLLAVAFAWLFGNVFLSLFLSVVAVPLLMYLYVRFLVLVVYRRRYLPDVQTGIYKYWTEKDSGRILWVAEVDDVVVGTIAIETHSAIVVEMKHLSVAPACQCLGIGGKLAQHALSHIQRRRFKKVIAHVLSIHAEAVTMYSKLGFRRTNVRTVWAGLVTLEDYALNLSVGSRANVLQAEEDE